MSAQGDAQAGSQGALIENDYAASEYKHEAREVCLDGHSLGIAAVVAVAR